MLQAASSALRTCCANPAVLVHAARHLHLATKQVASNNHVSSLLTSTSSCSATARPKHCSAQLPADLSFRRGVCQLPANHASTWPAACHELEQNAPAGSEWPQHSKLVLDKVAELLGGRWLVVQSGNFSAEQPRADQPARALVHVVMCYTNEQGGQLDSPVQGAPQQDGAEPLDAGSTSSTQQGVAKPAGKDSKSPPVFHPLKQHTKVAQLPPGSTPMYYLVAYQLDDNHWPTGYMYNSASQFERATTSSYYKKPEQSLRVVWEGRTWVTYARWHKDKAGRPEYGMRRVPKTHNYHLANWYKEAVKSVGVKVMEEMNAVSLSLAAKKQRDDSAAAAKGTDADQ